MQAVRVTGDDGSEQLYVVVGTGQRGNNTHTLTCFFSAKENCHNNTLKTTLEKKVTVLVLMPLTDKQLLRFIIILPSQILNK